MFDRFFKVLIAISIVIGLNSMAFAGPVDDMLLNAIANNDLDMAQTAVENGADVNYVKTSNYTPLGLAAKNGNSEMVAFLLKNKANPNQKVELFSDYTTPLILAVEKDDLASAKLLVEAGANVNTPFQHKKETFVRFDADSNGSTPLILAIQKTLTDKPSLEMVQFLISKKANVNLATVSGFTPLMAAASYKWGNNQEKRCRIAKELLNAGADPARKDKYGKIALQYAIDTNFKEMINLLLPVSPKK